MSRLLFVHDTYYTELADGHVHAHGAFPYALWKQRYLPHFQNVTVIGRRAAPAASAKANGVRGLPLSSGPNVTFHLLPNINSFFRMLSRRALIRRDIAAQIIIHDAAIIRGPAEFGMIASSIAHRLGIPYAVEMSGCAFDHVWNHGAHFGQCYAPLKYLRARRMVKQADGVLYVTKKFLQDRYPAGRGAVVAQASNVEIAPPNPGIMGQRIKRIKETNPYDKESILRFGIIGNFNNNLKGLLVALKALSRLKNDLPLFELRLLGICDQRHWDAEIAAADLARNVIFDPPVANIEDVASWLDHIDIYLQPSLHEGLPRSLIEAMSRGCPVLASDAGGIPEILSPEYLHKKGNNRMLEQTIRHFLLSGAPETIQDKLKNAAVQNFETAQLYSQDILSPRRAQFLKDCFLLPKS